MRILIDLTSLADNFSGIEHYAASLALELVKDRRHTWILVFKEQVHPMFACAIGQEHVEQLVLPRCGKLLFNQLRLPWALRRVRADWYLFLAFPVPVLLWKKNMISTIHDICCYDCPETMNALSKWYFRISHRVAMVKCRKIITISEFSRERIVERLHYPREKLLLVYCGVDRYPERPEEEAPAVLEKYRLPRKYLLSLSTLEPRKNLMLLVKAYEKLLEAGKLQIPLVLAGRVGWKTEELFGSLTEKTRSNILFTGFIDEADLPVIYRNAFAFVFPSKYEGFGMPPLEAMACGIPVVSSDAASMPEVLGEACVYFESENQESLEQALLQMTGLPEGQRKTMIAQGYERVELFTWEGEARKLLNQLTI